MSPPPERAATTSLLEALGIDLESTLASEPRFLLDARFLGALHAELREEFGPGEAEETLFQMGFVHGLRDGAELVQDGMRAVEWNRPPTTPRVPMRITTGRERDPRGSLEIHGSWPERQEAEALLSTLGRLEGPACAATAGYTSGWLSGLFSADVLAVEVDCGASGGACRFVAREAAGWRERGDERAGAWLEGLPFAQLRELVGRQLRERPEPPPAEGLQTGAPVIHVWGPVMVLPFAGVDESLRALDLIGNDPGARDVRVVIIDLSDTLIDEGFGAVAIEQILGAVERWGAEAIVTGISPLSARVIEELEHSPLLCHKDLPEAVAAAFRIADAQRQAV